MTPLGQMAMDAEIHCLRLESDLNKANADYIALLKTVEPLIRVAEAAAELAKYCDEGDTYAINGASLKLNHALAALERGKSLQ